MQTTTHGFELIIFDLDGTLFHTAPTITETVNHVLSLYGKAALPESEVTGHIGEGLKSLMLQIDPTWAADTSIMDKIMTQFYSHYDEIFLRDREPFDGAIEFLQNWKGQIAIVSNKSERYVKRMVENSELRQFNWAVIHGGDSKDYKKPDPRSLFDACEAAGIAAKNAVMIGDGYPDVLAAKAANIACLAVEFGYSPVSELIELGAQASLKNYRDLDKMLTHLRWLLPNT